MAEGLVLVQGAGEPDLGGCAMCNVDQIYKASFVAEVVHRDELSSTNDLALQLVSKPGPRIPLLVIADRQTAGRGRGANRWWASDGALTFTLVLSIDQIDVPQRCWPSLSLATAVAISSVLESSVPAATIGVKWPNDVFADRRKVSGILVEVRQNGAGQSGYLAVGIGINVNNAMRDAPPEIQEAGVALCDLADGPVDADEVLLATLQQIEMRLAQLRQGDPRLPDAWNALDVLRGRSVAIDLGKRTIEGIGEGINAEGALLLAVDGRTETISGGVVRSVDGVEKPRFL